MLYAFDGTGNADHPGDGRDTNVVFFRNAYRANALYYRGIGTRFGFFGAVVGSITGVGGRSRADEAYDQFELYHREGDRDVDIVGFSRGAALALHFANKVARHRSMPAVRFLGLFDCVPSFGIASLRWNIGWDLHLPAAVRHAFHALALDERRHTFRLHRPKPPSPGVLTEVWFAGIHADVGGGNANDALSSIPLHWMLQQAVRCGLPIDPAAIRTARATMRAGAPSSRRHRYDLISNRFRRVQPGDFVHASVGYRADLRNCNNPPVDCPVVDDDGLIVRRFTHAVSDGVHV